jgi:hypothetical protein
MDFSSGWREIKKTRKDHRCWGCAEVIPAGSHAWYEAGKYDGDFYADYYCDNCKSFLDEHHDYFEDGIHYGEIGDARKEFREASV